MENIVDFLTEYHGTPSREHLAVPVPSAAEIARLCTNLHPYNHNVGLAYPHDAPVFWIKYGPSVIWDELDAQSLAHEELKRLGSPVKVPAVYYACKLSVAVGIFSYVVMDYVSGSTVGKLLKGTDDPVDEDILFSHVAMALSELHRIPVPAGRPPSGINGGNIRHFLFDDQEAPRKYQNAQELETHLNEFLVKTRRKNHRIEGLSLEPMVFCYSDLWPHNFMVDDNGQTFVVDFAHASFLPSSFSRMILVAAEYKIGRDLTSQVMIRATDGVDNSRALCAAGEAMAMGSGTFVALCESLFGDNRDFDPSQDEKRTWSRRVLRDEQGQPVEVSFDVPPPTYLPGPPAVAPPGFKW